MTKHEAQDNTPEAPKEAPKVVFSSLVPLTETFISDKLAEAMVPDAAVLDMVKKTFTEVGTFLVLPSADEDTDKIIRKEFLKAAKFIGIRLQSTLGKTRTAEGEVRSLRIVRAKDPSPAEAAAEATTETTPEA